MATGMPTLKQGMNPTNATPAQIAAIKQLQDFLKIKTTPNDYGYFGPKTTAAVKAFQKAQGFSAKGQDGIVGPMTWAKIPVQPTPAAKAQATADAAVQAIDQIKQDKAKAQAAQAAKIPAAIQPRPVAPAPPAKPATPAAVVQQAATTAKKAVTATATKTKDAVVATHVIIKKQPLALQVLAYATAGLGAVAGFHAIREFGRKQF